MPPAVQRITDSGSPQPAFLALALLGGDLGLYGHGQEV